MPAQADRVKQTTTTTGTGTVDLDGTVSGFRTFVAGVGNGGVCDYAIFGGSEWEVGRGTVTDASPDTLSRDEVYRSSNSDALVNFSAGTKTVLVTSPAERGRPLLAKLKAADFNVTTDQPIYIGVGKYVIRRIVVTNASISLTTAAGGLYTGAGKTGTTLVAAAQVYTALTASGKFLDLTLEAVVGTDVLTVALIYLSLTTAQGAAATADVYVFGEALP